MEISRDLYLELSPYLELIQGVRTALSVNEGIIKIVGPEGSGKSALCHKLEADLNKEGTDVIYFSSAPESSEYLYERIQSHLGLDKNKNFNKSLTNYLLAKSPPNNKLVVIYDNAEKISKDLFILIRLLNNIHGQSETLVAQVICGTDKLDTLFDDPDLRSLTQYLNQSFTIPPMTREQIQDFYSGFRNTMNITGKELNNTDLTNIYMQGKGMPGKTLELMQLALEPAVDVADSADDLPTVASTTADTSITDTTITDTTITDTTKPYKLPDLPDPGDLDTIQPEQDPAPIVAQQVAKEAQESRKKSSSDEQVNLEQEVSEILSQDNDRRTPAISHATYFKAGLSFIVLVVSVVLAVVLSRDDEIENNRLAEILADDSPLFMDEVAGTSESEGANESPAEIPIPPEAENELTNDTPIEATARIVAETAPTSISAEPNSDSLVASINDSIDENSEQNNITQLDTPEVALAEENPEEIIGEELAEVIVEEIEEALEEPAEIVATIQESETATSTPTEDASPEENIQAALNAAISNWVKAWADGNFMGYLAVYHESFIPSNIDSYDNWVNQRRVRIEGVQGINIGYDRFELIETSPETATVRFWQSYARNTYADETWKELQFQNNNGTWLITSERNLQVNRLSN